MGNLADFNDIFSLNVMAIYRERNKNRVPIKFWIGPWQLSFCYDIVRI